MKKIIMIFLISLICVISGSVQVQAKESESKDFVGTRKVQYQIDRSDLDNFIDGGRIAFDVILRSNIPEGVCYEISAQGRNVYLSLWFEFQTYYDYIEKTEQLLMEESAIIYLQENGLHLFENHEAIDFLNFLENALLKQDCLLERTLHEMFSFCGNSIVINSVAYEFDGKVNIRPENIEKILFRQVKIYTAEKKKGHYNREITVQIDMQSYTDDDVELLENRFKQVGEVKVTYPSKEYTKINVSFDAMCQSELEQKTTQCLFVATSIVEKQSYIGENYVGVNRTEFFDIKELISDEGEFSYHYEIPSYYINLSANDDITNIDAMYINSYDESYISFIYEREFWFDKIEFCTDLSNPFGKIERKIICVTPTDIAVNIHDSIRTDLENKLVRGSVLNIYDDLGYRYYEISFSSWFIEEIESFTKEILDFDYDFTKQSSWIPLGYSEINDCFAIENVLTQRTYAEEITAYYILPEWSVFDKSMEKTKHTSFNEKTVSFFVRSNEEIILGYREINIMRCTAIILGILFFVGVIWKLYKGIKWILSKMKKKNVKNHAVISQRESKMDNRCSCCGNMISTEMKFCNKCGQILKIKSKEAEKKTCPSCGTLCDSEAEYCGECGIRMDERL